MRRVRLAGPVDLPGFRVAARAALARGEPPEALRFAADDAADDLFARDPPEGALAARPASPPAPPPPVAARFVDLADLVCRHRAPERYDLLYRALWRMRETPALLGVASDPLVRRLEAMERAVRRDRHKMTAFLRFREVAAPDGLRFVAWFEPEHFVEELAAPFFVDRFAAMRFAILTPRVSILWDGALTFGPGARREEAPPEDGFAAAWETYYRAIFNPARLNPAAMLREMPKRYWRNLPETRAVGELIAQAGAREAGMLARPPTPAPARTPRIVARLAERACVPDRPADEPPSQPKKTPGVPPARRRAGSRGGLSPGADPCSSDGS